MLRRWVPHQAHHTAMHYNSAMTSKCDKIILMYYQHKQSKDYQEKVRVACQWDQNIVRNEYYMYNDKRKVDGLVEYTW